MTIIINTPLALYNQMASFCFLSAGTTADLLIVRICLMSAYICLFCNAIFGGPLWPNLRRPNHISLDALFWAVICFYTHAMGVYNMLKDERTITLSDDEEALWRLLYRAGGVSRLTFYHYIKPHLQVVTYKYGAELSTDTHFYIVYKGIVVLDVSEDGHVIYRSKCCSGELFDFKHLGIMHNMGRMANHKVHATVHSPTGATVFQFTTDSIRKIATNDDLKKTWQTVFIGILTRLAIQHMPSQQEQQQQQQSPCYIVTSSDDITTIPTSRTSKRFFEIPNYIDDLFFPLRPWEEPKPFLAGSGQALKMPFRHIKYYLTSAFSPPWPFGKHKVAIRHRLTAPLKDMKRSAIARGIPDCDNGDTDTMNNSDDNENDDFISDLQLCQATDDSFDDTARRNPRNCRNNENEYGGSLLGNREGSSGTVDDRQLLDDQQERDYYGSISIV